MDKKTFFVIFGLMLGIGLLSFYAGPQGFNNSNINNIISTNPSKTATVSANLYFIRIGDNGKSGSRVGCGDSLVAVSQSFVGEKVSVEKVLSTLLSIKSKEYGSSKLYNSLSESQLSLASLETKNGIANVKLNGKILMNGTCDGPRIKSQLEETVRVSTGLKTVKIVVNNKDLDSVLSGK